MSRYVVALARRPLSAAQAWTPRSATLRSVQRYSSQSQDGPETPSWTDKPRKTAQIRDEQMKLQYPPYDLPHASLLRLTRSLVHVEQYLDKLQRSSDKVTAFDMEWNMSWKAGQERRTGLIQIAHLQHGYLLYSVPRGYYQELPASLRDYLSDTSIAKVGLNIKNDLTKLTRDWPATDFTFNHVIDLSDLAKVVDRPRWMFTPHVISLQELTGVYLERYLSKSVRGSTNWESLALDTEPLQYAAGDTLASLELYTKLIELSKERNIDLQNRHIWSSRDKISIMGSKFAKEQMTPRQAEAWMITFAHQGFSLDTAAREMSIKSTTVGRYLFEGLTRENQAYQALARNQISSLIAYAHSEPRLAKQFASIVVMLQNHLQKMPAK